MKKRKVVFGFLGQTMDMVSKRRGKFEKRFERWRPTVSLVQHMDSFPVHKLELIHHSKEKGLLEEVVSDIHIIAPEVEVIAHEVDFDSPWDLEMVFPELHGFISTYDFNLKDEEYFFHLTTGSNIQQASVFLSVGARYFPGKLLQSGPSSNSDIGSTLNEIDLNNAPKAIFNIFNQTRKEGEQFLKSGIQTKNAAFNKMIKQIERVAIRSKSPMLITGPTGAGKSALAGRIFDLKKDRHELEGEFVSVNCATLVGENAAMATLFGHTKGAYTGASSAREGLLKKANGGLVFLDEIGEMSLETQTMLLNAIELKEFYPMGSDSTVKSDFQLICGTNRDLRVEVESGRFREDLFARINLFTYQLPGLADRREDIEPNFDYELERYIAQNGENIRITPAARTKFLKFSLSPKAVWKGNFRDLNASVTRMCTLSDSGVIDDEVVDNEIESLLYLWLGNSAGASPNGNIIELSHYIDDDQIQHMDLLDQVICQAVIDVCKRSGSTAQAGRELYGVSRLSRKKFNDGARVKVLLDKYGLDFTDLKA